MKKIFIAVLLLCIALFSGVAFAEDRAVVKSQIAPLLSAPGGSGAVRVDEVLFGMVVEVIDTTNSAYPRVRTAYGLEAYAYSTDLYINDSDATLWESNINRRVSFPHADIHTNNGSGGSPSHASNGRMLGWLPKGALVHITGSASGSYYPINMPSWVTFTNGPKESPGANTVNRFIRADGDAGSKPSSVVARFRPTRLINQTITEAQFRDAIVQDALSYCDYLDTINNISDDVLKTLGTMAPSWRKGGKTHQGMDASGLVHMVYLLNDKLITRYATPTLYGTLRMIDSDKLGRGDVICWDAKDGRGIYIGNNQFVYASYADQKVRIGKIGVDLLAGEITAYGSLYFTEVTGVTLDKTSAAVLLGNTLQLTATVIPSNATNKALTWECNSPYVAAVSQTGLVTTIGSGSAYITVRTLDGGFEASCYVLVSTPASKVTITPKAVSVDVGDTYWLTAEVEPFNVSNSNLTWSSSNTAVATVNQAGFVTGVTPGTVTITATAADGSGVYDTCTVNVPLYLTTGVKLNKNTLALLRGESERLIATVLPTNATNKNVKWSSNSPYVFEVDQTGLITTFGAGSGYDTVTTEDGGIVDSCYVLVTVPVSGITISPASVSVGVGQTCWLTANVEPFNAGNANVAWSSSNTAIATVNQAGFVSGVTPGNVTITATATDGSGVRGTCAVTITP
jgi:uncharacterized protein YjdB